MTRWFRRRERDATDTSLPTGWESVVDRNVALWASLDADERVNAVEAMVVVLSKRFEAARGFDIDLAAQDWDEIRVTIAAQAALLAIALDLSVFDDVPAVVVHPTTIVIDRPRATGVGAVVGVGTSVLGVAHDRRGPIVLAWDAVLEGCRHPERGHNVVLHEFAHKLDLTDRVIDGTPILDSELHARWVEVCTDAFDRLRGGERSVIDDYGATNPGEFFAVATEAFFCTPGRLRDGEPALYDVLAEFYGQDPTARIDIDS